MIAPKARRDDDQGELGLLAEAGAGHGPQRGAAGRAFARQDQLGTELTCGGSAALGNCFGSGGTVVLLQQYCPGPALPIFSRQARLPGRLRLLPPVLDERTLHGSLAYASVGD